MALGPTGVLTTRVTKAVRQVSYLAALVLFVAACVLTAQGQIWIVQLGGLSSVGLATGCALYALSEHRFRSSGASPMKSVVLAALFANAFLQSYELIYGISFIPSGGSLDARTTLLWLLMITPLVLASDYLRFKLRTSLPLITLFGAVWILWILYGFPQYYIYGLIYRPVFITHDPYRLSYWFDFGAKAVYAGFYASLLQPLASLRDLINWGRDESIGPPAK